MLSKWKFLFESIAEFCLLKIYFSNKVLAFGQWHSCLYFRIMLIHGCLYIPKIMLSLLALSLTIHKRIIAWVAKKMAFILASQYYTRTLIPGNFLVGYTKYWCFYLSCCCLKYPLFAIACHYIMAYLTSQKYCFYSWLIGIYSLPMAIHFMILLPFNLASAI